MFNNDDLLVEPGDTIGCMGRQNTQSLTALNGELWLTPLNLPRMVILSLVMQVVTTPGSAGALLRMGLYLPVSPVRPRPGPLLIDAGTVSAESNGQKVISVAPFIWPGGLLFAAGVGQGAPVTGPTVRVVETADVTTLKPSTGDIITKFWRVGAGSVLGALPTDGTTIVGGSGSGFMFDIIAGDIKNVRP